MRTVDMSGQTLGLWFIKERVIGTTNGASWLCICTGCGVEKVLKGNSLRKGTVVGGCRRCRSNKNEASEHPDEYKIWACIKTRALNPNRENNKAYIERGIAKEWADSFASFFANVGARPSAAHSVERIDNDVGYFPGNVRWATSQEQARNTSRNLFVVVEGQKMCLLDAAKILPIPYNTMRDWVHAGIFEAKIAALTGKGDDQP